MIPTSIELDNSIYLKPVINIYNGSTIIKQIFPKEEKKDEVFSQINKKWYEQIKKELEEKDASTNRR